MKNMEQNTVIVLLLGVLGILSLGVLAFVPDARNEAGIVAGSAISALATLARQMGKSDA